jgi:hypothetical protein
MKPGDLVTPAFGDKQIYKDIVGHHRIFLGTFAENSIGVCLDFGFSNTDVPYYKVIVNGMIGWVRLEGLKLLT